MKNVLALIAATAMITTTVPAMADDTVAAVVVDGTTVSAVPVGEELIGPLAINGFTYLPLDAMGAAFNLSIEWNEALRTVFIGGVVDAEASEDIQVYLNGNPFVPVDTTPVQNIGGNIFLPVRPIAEALGKEVNWDQDGKTVIVTTPEVGVAPEENPNSTTGPETNILDTLPQYIEIPTPYVSQLSPVYAVVGCEGASLLMGLKAKGYCQDVGLRQFLDEMPKDSNNPAKGFVGSPYKAGQYNLRTTIYPAPLAQYASRYGNVVDISGSSPEEIQAEVLSGNPVLIYATLYWEPARYRDYNIEGETQTLLRNNHAVLINGYDRAANSYHIADPYNENDTDKEYFYWIDGSTLEPIYNIRRQAVVVR